MLDTPNTGSTTEWCVQVFTTVHPGQTDVAVMLYQGESHSASKNKQLSQFHLVGLPPAPVGVPQIEVSHVVCTYSMIQMKNPGSHSGPYRSSIQVLCLRMPANIKPLRTNQPSCLNELLPNNSRLVPVVFRRAKFLLSTHTGLGFLSVS